MNTVIYDGSFKGLLTAIFEVYEYKIQQPHIVKKEMVEGSLFGTIHSTETDNAKAVRVLNKLKEKLTPNGFAQLYKTFLSELREIEDVIYRYIAYVLQNNGGVENNYAHPDVLMLQQTSRKVDRERHRMKAFIRFQLTKDELYYTIIQPDYNVLPLIVKHFKDRYADQRWLIYDAMRKYGIYYDLENVTEVNIDFTSDLQNADSKAALYDESEELYQQLWQQYFVSVNIKARKNTKLHVQHMPKRYWKYLVEKQ